MGRSFGVTIAAAGILPLAVAAFLFVGLDRKIGEHRDSYTLFLKQVPTLKTVYLNVADCGMCEVVPRFEGFSESQRQSFAEYCRVRFGIDDIRVCHAIFREEDAILEEKAGDG
jgi:hypothetical protein